MKTIDTLFGQNWIDQFQANIETCPLLGDTTFHDTADILLWFQHEGMRCTMHNFIHCSFRWMDTPQHPDNRVDGIWPTRQDFNYDRGNHLSR